MSSSNYTATLKKGQLLRLYFRLGQMQIVGGRLAKLISFSKRLLKSWPELGPGEDEGIAAAIPADEVRNTLLTAEEMSAVADGFLRLLNSDSIQNVDGSMIPNTFGIKLEILKDAKSLSTDLEAHLLNRLGREPVEPFTPDMEPAAEDTKE